MTEVIQNPPEPRGIDAAALVVDDDARGVADAELRHQRLELLRRRQERRRPIGDTNRDRRQVDRAGHVAGGIRGRGGSHVDDPDVRVAGVRRDPVGLDQLFGVRVTDRQRQRAEESSAEFTALSPTADS